MISLVNNVAIYSNTGLNEAYKLTESQAKTFIESNEFKDWIKVKESEQKLQVDIINRLNGVISAVGVVVKAVSLLGRR